MTVKWDAIKVCPMTLSRSVWHFAVLNSHLQHVAALLSGSQISRVYWSQHLQKSRLGLCMCVTALERGQRGNVSRVQRSRVSNKAFITQFSKWCTNTNIHDLAQHWMMFPQVLKICVFVHKQILLWSRWWKYSFERLISGLKSVRFIGRSVTWL